MDYVTKLKNILKLQQWNGKKFKGNLIVYGEQGIGDQILFSSMLPDLSIKHSDVILSVDKRLINLFYLFLR